MDAFIAPASCFLLRSGLYIAVIVGDIFKLIMDASSTQLYVLGWRVSPSKFVDESGLGSHAYMDAFIAPASCFLLRSELYIAVIVGDNLKLIIDASNTQ